jgi:hypothetical protein
MGRIECVQIDGCVCWFYSRDHRPPHFHVKRAGEWEIRVFFHEEPPYYEEVFVVRRPSSRVTREILTHAHSFRAQLYLEWSEKVVPEDEQTT